MEAIASLYTSALGSNKWVQIWIITMTELVGDLNLKTFATTNLGFHFYAGVLMYIILALQLAVGFKTMGIGWLNGAWDGTSTVVSVLAGHAMGEQLTSQQYLGLALIISGLYLL
jgi:multidrug transporter EmrE-like cation transporter